MAVIGLLVMMCDVCGFDNGNGTESGNCLGCGVTLHPGKDDQPPAPGFEVHEDDDPHVVTDADKEKYPGLYATVVVKHNEYEFGRGIGAEPHGYFTRKSVEVVDLTRFDPDWSPEYDDESERNPVGECPMCGGERGVQKFSQGRAAIAGCQNLTCETCDHEFYEEFWT